MAARNIGEALVYLRRSTDQQELSLQYQLTWAIGEAAKQGIALDATLEDLEYARIHTRHSYKAIRLDDGISGADLQRPGLRAFIADLISNARCSHGFAYRRDRLARPEDPLEMMQIERSVSRAGVTLVFTDGVANPLDIGEHDIVRDITQLVAYHQSREWLESHAERIIATQQQLAQQGYSTGRRAPYGFARFLVDASGETCEELPPGRKVRQPGCHVVILPGDPEKIGHLCLMLDLRHKGHGWKWIAAFLDSLGVPSPDAGRVRTYNGCKRRISGKWCANTVANLCRNPLVIGLLDYGIRAEGMLRRYGPNGPRKLTDADLGPDDKPRSVINDNSQIIRAKIPAEPIYDPARWHEIQEQAVARGADQRGIPRAKDPAKFPLRLLLVDLTSNCGYPLYGRLHGKRAIYVCGRYWRTGGHECENNSVDAEAALRFTLRTIRQLIWQRGDAARLEALFRDRARRLLQSGDHTRASAITAQLEVRVESLKDELATVQYRMAREKDDTLYAGLAEEHRTINANLADAERKLTAHHRLAPAPQAADPEVEVAAAMSFLQSLERAANDPLARGEINSLLRELGVMIGLTFTSAIKGKKRVVRRLASGVMVFGGDPLPVPLYGRDNAEVSDEQNGVNDAAQQRGGRVADIKELKPQTERKVPQGGPAGKNYSGKDVSSQKVNRGDWI